MISKKGRLTNLKKSPCGEEEYESALEREYMVELERDPAVKKWTKRHDIKIPYGFLGLTRHYYPDFLVEYQNGQKEIQPGNDIFALAPERLLAFPQSQVIFGLIIFDHFFVRNIRHV